MPVTVVKCLHCSHEKRIQGRWVLADADLGHEGPCIGCTEDDGLGE